MVMVMVMVMVSSPFVKYKVPLLVMASLEYEYAIPSAYVMSMAFGSSSVPLSYHYLMVVG